MKPKVHGHAVLRILRMYQNTSVTLTVDRLCSTGFPVDEKTVAAIRERSRSLVRTEAFWLDRLLHLMPMLEAAAKKRGCPLTEVLTRPVIALEVEAEFPNVHCDLLSFSEEHVRRLRTAWIACEELARTDELEATG